MKHFGLKSLTLGTSTEVVVATVNISIGPNNSGKSTLLSELSELKENSLILSGVDRGDWSVAEIKEFFDERGNYDVQSPKGGAWRCTNWEESERYINSSVETHLRLIFREKWNTSRVTLDGNQRLMLVNDMEYRGIKRAMEKPKNIFERIRSQPEHRQKIQEKLQCMMPGKYFTLWNPDSGKLRAYLSDVEPPSKLEYFDTPEAFQFFESNAQPLSIYSDGVKAFLGIVANIVASDATQFFIDEPEAFLHPSLAFELGRAITELCRELNKVCYCASHSPYFLKGCLSVNPSLVSVTRLFFDGKESSYNPIESDVLLKSIQDPLLSSIGVTESLFHSRVIVTEGDSDRAFYAEINKRLLQVNGGLASCHFINAQNKQTIAIVIKLLRSLRVECVGISDIDVLKEGGTQFARVLDAIGLDGAVRESAELMRSKVNKSLKAAAIAKREVEEIGYDHVEILLNRCRQEEVSPREFLSRLGSEMRDPDYKRMGGVGLLENSEKTDAAYLLTLLAKNGWFVVENGELESWLSDLDVGSNKTGWLLRVFKVLGADPRDSSYLVPRPPFDDVWGFMDQIAKWFSRKPDQ